MKRIALVFGTRPEAIKMAPLVRALREMPGIDARVVVTAQHRELLDQVLDHFGIVPDIDLDIMSDRQSLTDIAVAVLTGLEAVFRRERFDLVLVHGDTSTTLYGSLAAYYQQIPVGHVEAGLRSYDRYAPFPEEANRLLTDQLASMHFAPTQRNRKALLDTGAMADTIYVTGNTAIDALLWTVGQPHVASESLPPGRVMLLETHRRENWGEPQRAVMRAVLQLVERWGDLHVLFSVHPNPTVQAAASMLQGHPRIRLLTPPTYPEWAHLMAACTLMLTDSGGAQEEAPALRKPVLLLRSTTERQEAIEAGTVRMVGTDEETVVAAVSELLSSKDAYARMTTAVNPYGDGQAAQRIAAAIAFELGLSRTRPLPYAPLQHQAHTAP